MKWLAILLAVAGFLGLLGFVWWDGHHGQVQADKLAHAEDKATVADLNTQGVKQSESRIRVTVDAQQAAGQLAATFQAQALAAGDAHAPLDPDRTARLLANDASLCQLDPDLTGCAAR